MRFFKNGVTILGAAIVALAAIGHLSIGFINAFSIWGWGALICIPLFPIAILGYPFIYWFVTGSGELFAIWGILMGCALVGGIVASLGEKLSGEG